MGILNEENNGKKGDSHQYFNLNGICRGKILWDAKISFYYELMEPDQIVSSQCYNEQLVCLIDVLEEKRSFL